jgi:hypothetical protein
MQFRLYIVLFLSFILTGNKIYSQTADPKFSDFKEHSFHKKFAPVFKISKSAFLSKKEISFRSNNANGKKPVFCRMEDNISNRYNFIFQLRAGSDEHYRSLAFPDRVEKRKKCFE